jgi:mitochondrial fission protein ELM1/glycosyltransferase involved in cell wall biosynthesis
VAGPAEWTVWCLEDGRPGHVNQSQGIIDALACRFPLQTTRITLRVKGGWRKRLLRWAVEHSPLRPGPRFIQFAYEISLPVQVPDLIIASGGDTQAALATLGAFFRVPTVYSGHPKGLSDTAFSRVVTVVPRAATDNNLVLPLPPAPRPADHPPPDPAEPCRVACLIGGETAGIRYSVDDWRLLANQLRQVAEATGARLLLTTSRRTGAVAEAVLKDHLPASLMEEAVWWSVDARPVVTAFLARAQSVIVTEDSLSMVAESLYSGLPVVSVLPGGAVHSRQDEQAMQGYAARGFLRRLVVGQAIPPLPLLPRGAPSWERVADSLCDSIAPLYRGPAGGWQGRTVLVWGRTGAYGPDYPRNRVVEAALRDLGIQVRYHRPRWSAMGDIEYRLSGDTAPDLIWVPCFRHRDVRAAARAAANMRVPLVFDPLVSAWEKKIHERQRYLPESRASRRLLAKERWQMSLPDTVVADTAGHAAYFAEVLGVDTAVATVVPVGAEQPLFSQHPVPDLGEDGVEFVWFGSFIGLHGLDIIASAVKRWSARPDLPDVHFRFLGEGPLRESFQAELSRVSRPGCRVSFEPWGPLQALPARLASAHVVLGIFDTGRKSRRVIPNKVYQGLALGRVVLTSRTDAYPAVLGRSQASDGIVFCAPGDSDDLLCTAMALAADPAALQRRGQAARHLYDDCFSPEAIRTAVRDTLDLASERFRNRQARECHVQPRR